MISRNRILSVLALVWVVGVSAYFVYDLYQGIRYGLYQNGVNQGYASAVNELITKVAGKCDTPTPITAGNKKVEIVDVTCLNPTASSPVAQSTSSGSSIQSSPTTLSGAVSAPPSMTPKLK